jgi:TRAP-type C4-dicarboxylate transport system permease small subunit
MSNFIARAERIFFPPIKIVHICGYSVIFLLTLLTVADIIGRKFAGIIPFFNPVPGTFELTEYALVVIVFASIGYTQLRKEHISIDIITSRFPPRVQAVLDIFMHLAGLAVFALVAWQSWVYAERLRDGQFVSGVLSIPQYPFAIIVAIGSVIYCLALLLSILSSLAAAVTHRGTLTRAVKDVA